MTLALCALSHSPLMGVNEPAAEVADVNVGDRVYVNAGLSCGGCRTCRRGEDQNCPAYSFMGYFGFGPDAQQFFDAGSAVLLTSGRPGGAARARVRVRHGGSRGWDSDEGRRRV